jgi:hypothetical protein
VIVEVSEKKISLGFIKKSNKGWFISFFKISSQGVEGVFKKYRFLLLLRLGDDSRVTTIRSFNTGNIYLNLFLACLSKKKHRYLFLQHDLVHEVGHEVLRATMR